MNAIGSDQFDDFGPLYIYQFRVIVLGDTTVGKSSLLKHFTEGRTADVNEPTVGVDFYARMVEIKPGFRIKLQLWDTAGQEKFRSITKSYYRNSVGIIIVYDISNRKTFENVAQWLSEAKANVGGPQPEQCVIQLVGHKADLESSRQVMYEEGEYFAKYHRVKFIETSAISGENIQEAFAMLAIEIHNRIENQLLQVYDGWEGIKSGVSHSKSFSLSDISGNQQQYVNNCSC